MDKGKSMSLTYKDNKDFYNKMLGIAIPITVSNLVSSSLNLVDNVMIGQLDAVHVSATGLANQITFVLMLLFFGINSGTCIFVAQSWGKREESSIKHVMGISYLLTGAVALIFFVASFFYPLPIMRFFTNDLRAVELGEIYLRIIAPSFLFMGLSAPLSFATRSINKAKIGMYASSTSLILNTALNYILIFGKLGFPAMGIAGAALATLISRAVEAAMIIGYSGKYARVLIIRWRDLFSVPRDLFQTVLKKCAPVIVNEGAWSLGMSAMTLIYARISTTASAAVFIAETIRMVFTVISFGVGNASAVMLGNLLGEGRRDEAIDYNKKFLQINTILGVLMGTTVYLLAPFIVNYFYRLDAEVSGIAIWTIRVIGLMLPIKFYNLVMIIGTFRAGGDTVFSMLIEAVGVWGVGVPAVYITGLIIGLPIPLVVLAANLDEVFKFFAGLPRVLSNKWAKTLV